MKIDVKNVHPSKIGIKLIEFGVELPYGETATLEATEQQAQAIKNTPSLEVIEEKKKRKKEVEEND